MTKLDINQIQSEDDDFNKSLSQAAIHVKSGELDKALAIYMELYLKGQPLVARFIGWIHDQPGFKDKNKAIYYLNISAERGDDFSQHYLGGIYREIGELQKSIKYYENSASSGNLDCSYVLYNIYRESDETDLSIAHFDKAVKGGHPLAIRDKSIGMIMGRPPQKFRFFAGLLLYVRNINSLIKHLYSNK